MAESLMAMRWRRRSAERSHAGLVNDLRRETIPTVANFLHPLGRSTWVGPQAQLGVKTPFLRLNSL
jgi:hypothetical protein